MHKEQCLDNEKTHDLYDFMPQISNVNGGAKVDRLGGRSLTLGG